MQSNDIEAFVKYPMFHATEKRKYKNSAFLPQNLFYNAEKDFFVCPILRLRSATVGQRLEKIGSSTRKSESGFISKTSLYQAKRCTGCPLKCLCHKAKGNRRIEINHKLNKYRENARELLTSEEGLQHRSRRPIEPEAVFGQTKSNKQYERFRHFGLDKVKMDFAIFAIAFNLGKMHNKAKNTSKKQQKSTTSAKYAIIFVIVLLFAPKKNSDREFYQERYRLAA
jgi:hypothetical protein